MLMLWLMGAAAYVAALGVYVTWRLVPACGAVTGIGTGLGSTSMPCSAMVLEAAADNVFRVVRVWLLCAAALVPLLAWMVYRRLYRPLARLDEGLARVSAGDLTTPILIEHGDELGRLGDQFNAMTLVLQERAEEERRRARRQTERLEEQLFERERLAILGRMAGAIAHEVGAPLNSVLGHTQLLAREQLSERGRHRLTIIESQVQRMVQVIQGYLARTRGAPAEREPLDVNDLVQDALVQLDVVLTRARVHARVDADPTHPIVVADRDGLLRVFINLMQNAIDAMPNGGTLSIAIARVDPPEAPFSAIAIDVSDTGTGIPPEARARIFDLFFTTKPQGRGTGMGLSIVLEIVKMLGGRIDVASEVGHGTRMRVLLPAASETEMLHQQPPAAFLPAEVTSRLET
jgi:two-component system, NtrC family, sensor kinase